MCLFPPLLYHGRHTNAYRIIQILLLATALLVGGEYTMYTCTCVVGMFVSYMLLPHRRTYPMTNN